MPYNTYQEQLLNQMINDIALLKQQMNQLRTNQVKTISFGNIMLDGSTGKITVGSSPNQILIDGTNNKITLGYGSATPIVLDSTNKKITFGNITLDGVNGKIMIDNGTNSIVIDGANTNGPRQIWYNGATPVIVIGSPT